MTKLIDGKLELIAGMVRCLQGGMDFSTAVTDLSQELLAVAEMAHEGVGVLRLAVTRFARSGCAQDDNV